MTALIQYEAARAALASVRTVEQVFAFEAEMEHVKLYGRQISDRTLIADATELQTRAQRRLGELLLQAERLGWIGRGRPKENVPTPEHFTLDEAGITRKESARAQKLAALPEAEFEQGVEVLRDRVMSGATTINGARAIMSSRQEPDGSLDFFPTPPWATRALIEYVLARTPGIRRSDLPAFIAWEPACGEGHIAEVLREYFAHVTTSDIADYGYSLDQRLDFTDCSGGAPIDWIITNPPFGEKTEQFVLKALELASVGVAMFVRLQWLESVGRYEAIFRDHPPTVIAFFAERVNLCKGRWEPEGSTATAYIWLVWVKGMAARAPIWIPPGQREQHTHSDDIARFTAHPVTKSERAASATDHAAPDAAPCPPPDSVGAASPFTDDLDLPQFLRRAP